MSPYASLDVNDLHDKVVSLILPDCNSMLFNGFFDAEKVKLTVEVEVLQASAEARRIAREEAKVAEMTEDIEVPPVVV